MKNIKFNEFMTPVQSIHNIYESNDWIIGNGHKNVNNVFECDKDDDMSKETNRENP